MSRIVEFADGYESSTAPASGAVQATALKSFPNDAAYVTDKGSAAAEGDTYWNSTDDQPKYYTGGAWVQGVTTAGAQTIGGNKTFSDDVVIGGNLTVQGTQTILNTQTLDVEDANVTVNKGGNVASADAARAGIEVELSDATEAGIGFDSTSPTKFKVGEVGSQSPVVSEAATQTLTGKTIDDDTNTIQNVAVTALKTVIGNALKFLSFDAAGAPISTKAVPTGVVVGTTDAQVLTAKDYDGGTASNTNRTTLAKETTTNLTSLTRKQGNIFYDTTKNKPVFDDGTNLNEMGGSGGSGSGRVNNLDSNDANLETSIGNWVTFDDGASLVDGSGGSPTVVTVARNTTAPLASTGDLKISHTAADGLGEGVSVPFTSRNADKSSVQEISFDYITTAGYADDVMELWIYDVTNTKLIAVTPLKLKASLTPSKFKALFQNDATSTSYRLIFFCSTTAAVAFDIQVDNLLVGPPIYNYGLVGSDYAAFIPTLNDLTNVDVNTAVKRRVGDELEIHGYVSWNGGGVGAALTVDLPDGLIADTSKLSGVLGEHYDVGHFGYLDNGVNYRIGYMALNTTTQLFFVSDSSSGAYANTQFANNDKIKYVIKVPIVGWSSNVQMSDEASLRMNTTKYSTASAQAIPNASSTIIDFDTKEFDDLASVTTGGSWKFVAKHSGKYRVEALATLAAGGAWGVGEQANLSVFVNGSEILRSIQYQQGAHGEIVTTRVAGTLNLLAGQEVDVRMYQDSDNSINLNSNATDTYVCIDQIQGPSAIAANELVIAKYSATTLTTAIPNTSSPVVFDCPTKVFDSHGMVTTGAGWAANIKVAGKYRLTMSFLSGGEAWVTGDYLIADVFKNGVAHAQIHWNQRDGTATLQVNCHGSAVFEAAVDDDISVAMQSSRTGGDITAIEANGIRNYITIERIGF